MSMSRELMSSVSTSASKKIPSPRWPEPHRALKLPVPGVSLPEEDFYVVLVADRSPGLPGGVDDSLTWSLVPAGYRGAALSFSHGAKVVALIPVTEESYVKVVELVEAQAPAKIESSGGGRSVAVGVAANRYHISSVVGDMENVIHIVTFLGYSPGIYQMQDVLTEMSLFRSPDIAAQFAERLLPLKLAEAPLLETLMSYIEHGRERSKVAAQLHIHPNTLDYRLRRIHELTGLSPWLPKDIHILVSASIAVRLPPGSRVSVTF